MAAPALTAMDTKEVVGASADVAASVIRRPGAAREAADHPLVSDLSADRGYLLLDGVGHRPGRLATANSYGKCSRTAWPCWL